MISVVVDFETRSRVDLGDVGAYKYARHASTEVLCMGYQVGLWPREIWRPGNPFPFSEEWPDVVIEAFNAAFEIEIWNHTCTRLYGWPELSPNQVQCLQARAAYAGLPRKLDSLNKPLGLGKLGKDAEGHRAMLRLCKPVRAKKEGHEYVGGKFDDDESRHQRNRLYCERDVRAEVVVSRLCKPLPATEQEVWLAHHDINQRGVPIDLGFCRAAAAMVEREQGRLAERLEEITGIVDCKHSDLPKLKSWMADRGLPSEWPRTKSGGPKMDETTVQAAVEGKLEVPEDVLEVLQIRMLSRNASVAKYKAMLDYEVKGRCYGTHMYYKAGPGRFAGCLTGDHEVLTQDGWVRMDEWDGGYIACWKDDESIAFSKASRTVRPYTGDMVSFTSKRMDQLATTNHEMPCWSVYTGQFSKLPVTDINVSHRLPVTGYLTPCNHVDRDMLRVLVMVQADGHFTKPDGSVRLAFTKTRKAERCKRLLRRVGLVFSESRRGRRWEFLVRRRHVPLWIRMFGNKTFGTWLFDCDGDTFFDELQYWDAYKDKRQRCNSFQYCTTNKTNADLIQAFAHLTGRTATMLVKQRDRSDERQRNWADAYYVQVWDGKGNRAEIRAKQHISNTTFRGNVYCAKTPTGFFLVRRNGKVWVTGNSGPQFQNQARLDESTLEKKAELADYLSDAGVVGDDLSGVFERLQNNGGVMPTLGSMVRLAVKAKPGNVLVVGDWSAIEMRILHWLAGDEATLKQIRDFDNGQGEEPYKLAAAMMYGKPASEITKAERQQGKVMILGSGYCTGAATFQAFCAGYGINMPLDRAKEVIQLYRRSYPLVKRLWYKLQDAAINAVTKGGKHRVGYVSYYMTGNTLNLRLPSGREVKYYDAKVVEGDFGPEVEATNPKGGGRYSVGLPILINNADQGTARDLLCEALVKCRKQGLPVVMHVHDEIVLEVAESHALEYEQHLKEIMLDVPRWAKGLPLKVGTGISERYTK